MAKCKICKEEVPMLYDGRCPACMSLESVEIGQSEIDYVYNLYDMINTPLADGELMQIFKEGKILDVTVEEKDSVESVIENLTLKSPDARLYRTPITQLHTKFKSQITKGEYHIDLLKNYGVTCGGQVVEIKSGVVVYKMAEYYDEDEVSEDELDEE